MPKIIDIKTREATPIVRVIDDIERRARERAELRRRREKLNQQKEEK